MTTNIKFAKTHPNAIIPSKNDEDMGLDIYACFDEDCIEIEPHQTVLIPTGIASCCDLEYGLVIKERSSTGSKGIAVRAGIIDSSYRGEIKVAITNTTEEFLFISKINKEDIEKRVMEAAKQKLLSEAEDDFDKELIEESYNSDLWKEATNQLLGNMLVYPYSKAIAQALVVPVPQIQIEEISYEELKNIPSKRGTGGFGSSGK